MQNNPSTPRRTDSANATTVQSEIRKNGSDEDDVDDSCCICVNRDQNEKERGEVVNWTVCKDICHCKCCCVCCCGGTEEVDLTVGLGTPPNDDDRSCFERFLDSRLNRDGSSSAGQPAHYRLTTRGRVYVMIVS